MLLYQIFFNVTGAIVNAFESEQSQVVNMFQSIKPISPNVEHIPLDVFKTNRKR